MSKPLASFLVGLAIVGAILVALRLHMPNGKPAETPAVAVSANPNEVKAHAVAMGEHMMMTTRHPEQPGDKERADAIEAAALKFAGQYKDYRKAEADGFVLQYPEMKQTTYHFARTGPKAPTRSHFDPGNPPMLLYEATGPDKPGVKREYKLVGVMYTAPFEASDADLNSRVPLSIAQWHAHTNLCIPPPGSHADWVEGDSQFGEDGSISTEAACRAAGGKFVPHFGAWMLHVYPFHKDQTEVWNASMFDVHHTPPSTAHGSMADMPGMKM